MFHENIKAFLPLSFTADFGKSLVFFLVCLLWSNSNLFSSLTLVSIQGLIYLEEQKWNMTRGFGNLWKVRGGKFLPENSPET